MPRKAKASSLIREILAELKEIEVYNWTSSLAVLNSVSQLRSKIEEAVKDKDHTLPKPKLTNIKMSPPDKFKHSMSISPMTMHAPLNFIDNGPVYIPAGISITKPITSKM